MNDPTEPTKEDYDAAKQRQVDNPGSFSADDPTAEVIADVELIRNWEASPQRLLDEE